MPHFRYIAREANGKRVQGEFEAVSSAEAERWLREWGLEPLEITCQEREPNRRNRRGFRVANQSRSWHAWPI